MEKFRKFKEFGAKVERDVDIEQYLFKFKNGYGASVVKGKGIYGSREFPYELAVIKHCGDNWELCYTTSITNDVLGYLNEDGVVEILEEIQELEEIQDDNI